MESEYPCNMGIYSFSPKTNYTTKFLKILFRLFDKLQWQKVWWTQADRLTDRSKTSFNYNFFFLGEGGMGWGVLQTHLQSVTKGWISKFYYII